MPHAKAPKNKNKYPDKLIKPSFDKASHRCDYNKEIALKKGL